MFEGTIMRESILDEITSIQSIIDSFNKANTQLSATTNTVAPVRIVPSPVLLPVRQDDSDTRPSHSYLALITMALEKMPGRQGSLHEIYKSISTMFPFYTKNRRHWKNSVRHNLALHNCFVKLDSADTADNRTEVGKNKRSRISPTWYFAPESGSTNHNASGRSTSGVTARKRKEIETKVKKSSPLPKKTKKLPCTIEVVPPPTASPLARISKMLPEMRTSTANQASAASQTLRPVNPPCPVTPDSDYGSLCSDRSPCISGPSFFDYQISSYLPSVDQDGRFNHPLPHLSADEVCAILQTGETCHHTGRPYSGTGAELLDGFGWFNELSEPVQLPQQQVYRPAFPGGPIDQGNTGGRIPQCTSEPPALSFLVPKADATKPLSVIVGQHFW